MRLRQEKKKRMRMKNEIRSVQHPQLHHLRRSMSLLNRKSGNLEYNIPLLLIGLRIL
jgi:hypothetical protein